MSRVFTDVPAERKNIPLLIGLMGPSGGGKTLSALRLATGIQTVTGGEIFYIDTEARRAAHYADQFRFRHVEFGAPFGSLDYLEALKYCVGKGAGVTIVDSMSHEHIGPGGYLLTQESELERMAGSDAGKRERMKMAAWIKPAGLRQQLIAGLLQLNSNFIFCFRAKEKVKPMKGEDGKVKPTEQGFQPQASEDALYEMTLNCVLLPGARGIPTWQCQIPAEQAWMKCPMQFHDLFAERRPLDEGHGKALAEWARGSTVATIDSTPLIVRGEDAASRGLEELGAYWGSLTPAEKKAVGGAEQITRWKAIAAESDGGRE